MIAAILILLMLSDQGDGYITIMHSLVDCQTEQNILAFFSQILTNISLNLCKNSDQK